MTIHRTLSLAALATALVGPAGAGELSLQSAPPVVVRTLPVAGATDVDPGLTEIRGTFSKPMRDGSWSWSSWSEQAYPKASGQPRFLPDGRTCVLPVKLEPGRFYALWLNSDTAKHFQDTNGTPSVPYLLSFTTGQPSPGAAAEELPLNDDQCAVLAWTDRQFRSYFDMRSFTGWAAKDYADLEWRLVDTLNGPQTREYYQAINTLAAMRSTNALPRLHEIVFDRADKNCRDRWMAIRALGLIGDKPAIPDLIHLVYHGNVNTRWWAQISLVRLTGRNFGADWSAWAKWWTDSGGQPPYQAELIRWWNGQPEPDKLAESLAENDAKFLADIRR